jgi:ferritin-like metal-binding protein YciE
MGMALLRLESLFNGHVQELHAAETHIVKDMPRLIQGALSSEFKSMLQQHAEVSARHARNLEQLLKQRGVALHTAHCKPIEVLLKQGLEIAERRGDTVLLDLHLISVLRQIESYQRCAYETARTLADALELVDVAKILDTHIREAGQMEQSWTVLSEDMVDSLNQEVVGQKRVRPATSQGGASAV